MAFEILLPTPHIPTSQLAKMPAWGDVPHLRVATPDPEIAQNCEQSHLGFGKHGMKCKYSISCKVN